MDQGQSGRAGQLDLVAGQDLHAAVRAAPGPRPSVYVSMQPWQVRTQRFRATRFGRRGLDPGEVRAFLDRLATELTAQHEALRAARLEAARLGGEVRRLRAERARRPNAGRR